MNLDWTRVATAETGTTRYVTRTEESNYVIVGRDVLVASVRGGAVTVRRFQAYEVDTGAMIGAERDRLSDAKREVAEYLDELDDAAITRTPIRTDSDDEELMEDLARVAARVAPVGADLDPTRAVPVTVDQAMQVILTVARKLDTDTGDARTLGDLAHLTQALGQAIGARAAVLSAQVVAQQHADTAAQREPGDTMHAIAAAGRDTVQKARESSAAAWLRLADAITAYGGR